jgi:hypothetical protein
MLVRNTNIGGKKSISAAIPHVIHPADEQGFFSATNFFLKMS